MPRSPRKQLAKNVKVSDHFCKSLSRADVNAKDNEEETPLHGVAMSERGTDQEKEVCCEILIRAGADLNAKNKYETRPLDLEVIKELRQKTPDLFHTQKV